MQRMCRYYRTTKANGGCMFDSMGLGCILSCSIGQAFAYPVLFRLCVGDDDDDGRFGQKSNKPMGSSARYLCIWCFAALCGGQEYINTVPPIMLRGEEGRLRNANMNNFRDSDSTERALLIFPDPPKHAAKHTHTHTHPSIYKYYTSKQPNNGVPHHTPFCPPCIPIHIYIYNTCKKIHRSTAHSARGSSWLRKSLHTHTHNIHQTSFVFHYSSHLCCSHTI